MFFLLFSIIWLIICSLFFIPFIVIGEISKIIIFIIFFYGIGIFLLYKGLVEFIRNRKTSKNGEICYGVVERLETTGSTLNGNPEYKAIVNLYVESQNKVISCSDKIGFKPEKYSEGKCVKLKYYEGDINFIEGNIAFENISSNAQFYLKDYIYNKEEQTYINSSVVYLNDNVIEVNGVKYKKMD